MTDAADGRGSAASEGTASTKTLDRPQPPDAADGPGALGAGDAGALDGAATAEPGAAGSEGGARYPVHRIGDLSRAGKLWAVLFALGLLLAPALAFAWAAPDWVPANDPALMGLRVLDVGSSATPLTGQPSTSIHYVGGERPVDHPGPIHFYVMVPFVRTFGVSVGMVLTSVLITGTCLLISAWAIFRQLGRGAGVATAVALGAITFTTGASSLVNPVSSNIAGYPLLCSVVLLFCLLCGDLRLLPLAAAVVSFAAQQHLSVLPALVVTLGLTLAVAGWGQWRHRRRADAPTRREWFRWGGGAALVTLVLWAPVLLQQVVDRPGNLTLMVQFASNGDREPVGMSAALDQLVNTLSLTHLLFRTNLDGEDVLDQPTLSTWLAAAIVVAALVGLGLRWRRTHPRRAALVASIAIVSVGGLVNGSSVPDSLEQLRLPFYHWTFALSLLVLVALALGVGDLVGQRAPQRAWALARPAAAGVALVGLVVPALVNPSIDRTSNTFVAAYSPVKRSVMTELTDEIAEHRDELGGDVLMMARGGVYYEGLPETVAVLLADRGIDLQLRASHLYFVDDERLASRDTVDSSVLIVQENAGATYDSPGRLIAEASIAEIDIDAFNTLVEQAEAYAASQEGKPAEIGPEIAAEFPHIPAEALQAPGSTTAPSRADKERLLRSMNTPESIAEVQALLRLVALSGNPRTALVDRALLQTIIDHPRAVPYLDQGLVEDLHRSIPDDFRADQPLRLRAYLLSRGETLATASRYELN